MNKFEINIDEINEQVKIHLSYLTIILLLLIEGALLRILDSNEYNTTEMVMGTLFFLSLFINFKFALKKITHILIISVVACFITAISLLIISVSRGSFFHLATYIGSVLYTIIMFCPLSFVVQLTILKNQSPEQPELF